MVSEISCIREYPLRRCRYRKAVRDRSQTDGNVAVQSSSTATGHSARRYRAQRSSRPSDRRFTAVTSASGRDRSPAPDRRRPHQRPVRVRQESLVGAGSFRSKALPSSVSLHRAGTGYTHRRVTSVLASNDSPAVWMIGCSPAAHFRSAAGSSFVHRYRGAALSTPPPQAQDRIAANSRFMETALFISTSLSAQAAILFRSCNFS